jgi:hypothetical protein
MAKPDLAVLARRARNGSLSNGYYPEMQAVRSGIKRRTYCLEIFLTQPLRHRKSR